MAVLMAVHNRKEHTLSCLKALFANEPLEDVSLSVLIVDDGSTDGTSEAVSALYPRIRIVRGDGTLYWNKGMHKAFGLALAQGYDYYLWLNDDTLLERDALRRLVACSRESEAHNGKPCVVVGSTRDRQTEKLTYGGQRRARNPWRPLFLPLIEPREEAQACDTMNGNIVLIPAAVAKVVGNLDPVFEHAMGDTDYGFRVRNASFDLWLAPGFFGRCDGNTVLSSFSDPRLSVCERWRKAMEPKGLPWRSWLVMTRRYAGPAWPLHFVWPYIKVLLNRSSGSAAVARTGGDPRE